MKRSEVLLKIQEAMVEAPDEIDEAADYILKAMERAGMFPPAYAKPIKSEYAEPGDYQSCFEWEPEDEKK
jgi:hypothetical protein